MGTNVVGIWEQVVKLLRKGIKDPASYADRSLYASAEVLLTKLKSLPPPPKSAWKKLVQQLQVPLLIGTALSTAAQHSPNSPGTNAVLAALDALLTSATAAGFIKDEGAAGTLGSSIRQQLQQVGVLQHLTTVMAAQAADLRSDAAALAGLSQDELGRYAASCTSVPHVARLCLPQTSLYCSLAKLWGALFQHDAATKLAWLCDTSSYTEAAMQLCTAALQHTSSMLQYVIPAVQQRAPQQAAKLLEIERWAAGVAVNFGDCLVTMLADTVRGPALAQDSRQQQAVALLQPLLLSPHCLPCLASLLVLHACWVTTAGKLQAVSDSQSLEASRRSSSTAAVSSGSRGGSRGSPLNRGRQQQQQQQQRDGDSPAVVSAGASSSSRAAGPVHVVGADTLTSCQLKVFQVLGLSPQLAAMVSLLPKPSSRLQHTLVSLIYAFGLCCNAAVGMVQSAVQQQPGVSPAPLTELEQQRWRFKQQLWLLLPSVLLPAAARLLVSAAYDGSASHTDNVIVARSVMLLIQHSSQALEVSPMLHSWLGGNWMDYRPPHSAWVGEVLDGVLQLLNQSLLQQQPQRQAASASGDPRQGSSTGPSNSTTTSSNTTTTSSSSSRNGGSYLSPGSVAGTQKLDHAPHLLKLLLLFLSDILKCPSFGSGSGSSGSGGSVGSVGSGGSNSNNSGSSSSSSSSSSTASSIGGRHTVVDGTSAEATPLTVTVPQPVADRFVEVCAAMEAGLRAADTAALQGISCPDPVRIDMLLQCSPDGFDTGVDGSRMYIPKSPLFLHLGLRGPTAQALERRQLYSLLGTIHKLGRSNAGVGGDGCWGQQEVNRCCWAAAQAANDLLQAALPAAPADEQAQGTPAAAVEQLEVEYLPSLVLFGRSCAIWAEQLKKQAPKVMLLLASEPAVQQQQQQQTDLVAEADAEEGDEEQAGVQGGVQREMQGEVCVPYNAAQVCIPAQPGTEAASSLSGPSCALELFVATVSSWVGGLTSPAAHTALAAVAGGDLQQFRQQLEALAAAQQAVRQEGLAALVQQLQATGVMLSSISVPHFCNNPACVNASRLTEVQLVSGRSCICAGCRTARYCGRVCQRQAWTQHKPVCKALAAAAAAASAAAAAAAAGAQ